MPAKSWSRSPRVILGSLTTLNALNYLDRYVSAATLPLILTDLAISDAQGGLLQSLFIVAYALACGPAGWLGDAGKRLHLVAGGVFVWSVATVASVSLSAAKSRIMDVDVAEETSNMSRTQILMQAGVSVLSQANQLPQVALKLLSG